MARDITEIQDFGKPYSEQDSGIMAYFVRTPESARIASLERIVVIGQRGAGKTALFQYLKSLQDPGRGSFVTGLNLRDYPWAAHDRFGSPGASPRERYVDSWIFMIAVQVAARIVQHRRPRDYEDRAARRAYRRLRRFLKRNYGGAYVEGRAVYAPSQLKLFWNLGKGPLGLGVEFTGERVEGAALANRVHDIAYAILRDVEALVKPGERHLVAFDELDEALDLRDPQYRDRLVGLLLAAKHVREWALERRLVFGAVVFIRSDLFWELEFPSKSRLRTGYGEYIFWQGSNDAERSLKSLMDLRVRVCLGLPEDDPDPWLAAFTEEAIDGEHKCEHMYVRSYVRPRDVIHFSNLALARAQERLRLDPASSRRITNDDVLGVQRAYSEWMYEELGAELHSHLPGWQELLAVLRRIGRVDFARGDFEAQYDAEARRRVGLEAQEGLDALYRFGVLAFQRVGDPPESPNWYWKVHNETLPLDPRAQRFTVNLGLKEYLDLQE